MRAILLKLGINLHKYGPYLEHQCEKSNENHKAKKATISFGNTSTNAGSSTGSFQILAPTYTSKPTLTARYKPLADAISDTKEFKPLCVNNFAPIEPWRKYEYLKAMVMPAQVVKFTHSSARQNMIFSWKVPISASASDILNRSTEIRDNLLQELPIYHTRAMRAEFILSFGKVTGCKSGLLREAYKRLTGDKSAAHDYSEAEVDRRVAELLDLQVLLNDVL